MNTQVWICSLALALALIGLAYSAIELIQDARQDFKRERKRGDARR